MKEETFTEGQEDGEEQDWWRKESRISDLLDFGVLLAYRCLSGDIRWAVEMEVGIQGRSQSWSCTFVRHHPIS